jgi:threonylcarbamoyladenosine tRNA methylthiotransferase CDKAL1
MKTFYIKYIGCERRGLDAEQLKNFLIANGLKRVNLPSKADYLFLSTCGLSKLADCSLDAIKELDEYDGELILLGCLPSMELSKITNIFDGKILPSNRIEMIDDIFPEFNVKYAYIEDPNKILSSKKEDNNLKDNIKRLLRFDSIRLKKKPHYNPTGMDIDLGINIGVDNNNFIIRISNGCLGNCSYCTIKKAIGNLKSKPVNLILKEVDKAIAAKQFKINLISSDTGSYGLDIKTDLPSLLSSILERDNRITIEFIQDLHPAAICRFGDELLNLIKTKRIKSILTAVQSGNRRILGLMNRPLDLNKFKGIIDLFKQAYPDLKLKTQIIAGFPTETSGEFNNSIDYVKSCGFDEFDIFGYFENKSAESSKLLPKVSEEVIQKRVDNANKILQSL